jgi:3-phosphoshikimate 1-carboxyvinyltransferase
VPRLEYDFVNSPDLAQTFVVTCALLGVHFRFTGLRTLRIKETDRISALKTEMRKLGFVIHDEDDSVLYWDGERCEPQEVAAIDTYEDHRMALAFAPVSLLRPIVINNPQVVTKSYPAYWEHLKGAGFSIIEKLKS